MTPADILAILGTIGGFLTVLAKGRGWWTWPAIGAAHEVVWLAYAYFEPGQWKLVVALLLYFIAYSYYIPHAYRERTPKWPSKLPRTPSRRDWLLAGCCYLLSRLRLCWKALTARE